MRLLGKTHVIPKLYYFLLFLTDRVYARRFTEHKFLSDSEGSSNLPYLQISPLFIMSNANLGILPHITTELIGRNSENSTKLFCAICNSQHWYIAQSQIS